MDFSAQKFSVREFSESNAVELCQWFYEKPYDIYNCPDWESVKNQNWGMSNADIRDKEFSAVYRENEFIGFFRLVNQSDFVMIGLGLRPDYCGRGYGEYLLRLVKKHASRQYKNLSLRLEVRTFNIRAIKCYQKLGFAEIAQYVKQTPSGSGNFVLMECANQPESK